jgi:hypothetical protein
VRYERTDRIDAVNEVSSAVYSSGSASKPTVTLASVGPVLVPWDQIGSPLTDDWNNPARKSGDAGKSNSNGGMDTIESIGKAAVSEAVDLTLFKGVPIIGALFDMWDLSGIANDGFKAIAHGNTADTTASFLRLLVKGTDAVVSIIPFVGLVSSPISDYLDNELRKYGFDY